MCTFFRQKLTTALLESAEGSAKSVVSSVVNLISSYQIGTHPLVKQFMKGVFHKNPSLPRNLFTWDVSRVLVYLRSLWPPSTLSLKLLSYKLVMLLALTTGQRIQTLHLIDIRNIEYSQEYMKISFGDLLKQTRSGSHLSELYIESFKPDHRLCVVQVLSDYMNRSKELRGNGTQLFISLQKPHKSVTKSTIGHWVKNVLISAGINMTLFIPHSTRSASTSVASNKVSVETVLKSASWKKDCVFRKYYKRSVTNNSDFSNAVLSECTAMT